MARTAADGGSPGTHMQTSMIESEECMRLALVFFTLSLVVFAQPFPARTVTIVAPAGQPT